MAFRGFTLAGLAFSFVALVGFTAQDALATEGYFQHGTGARNKAIGGAGVADSRDATANALNPAGLVHVEDQLNFAVSIFSPRRSFTGGPQQPVKSSAFGPFAPFFSGLQFTPTGEFDSQEEWFFIPNFAVSKRVNQPLFDVIAFSATANGGMNTTYKDMLRPDNTPFGAAGGLPSNCALLNPGGPGTGGFCNGALGVNLEQLLLSIGFAKEIMPGVSVGIAPILARQNIEIDGVQAFAGFSNAPGNVSNKGVSAVWGYGLRAGIEAAIMPNVRVGIAGNTQINMEEFDEYRGLFAENGDFDIPPSLQAGVAVDVTPDLTVMLDYKRIWYSEVASIGNPSANILTCPGGPAAGGPGGATCLGGPNGPGFGWDDINIAKVGVEWRNAMPGWTLRAGYAYAENPISSPDVQFNILAPGVVQHHITAGFKVDNVLPNTDFEVAGMYALNEDVNGHELGNGTPGGEFANSNHDIKIEMYQFELTLGLTYRFGGPEEEPLK